MNAQQESLYQLYFRLVEDTESPTIYHRWALIAGVGAFLGRKFWLPHGTNRIFPNCYVMLIGNPGTRKSSAVKTVRKVLSQAGYDYFAAERTTREKFLLDLEGLTPETEEYDGSGKKKSRDPSPHDILASLDLASGDPGNDGVPKEVFVVADEFNEFAGSGNIDFLSTLGAIWDWDDESSTYKQRFKNSKSISIFQPTVSILGGSTHSSLQAAFPAAAIGQGFLSRLILVHSEPSGKKITFPKRPDDVLVVKLGEHFKKILDQVRGEASISPEAVRALDTIYRTAKDLEDYRLKHYSSRRFTHLLKLCLITAAMRLSREVALQDVYLANTILTYTEKDMSKALGEYGKDINSEAKQNIMSHLYEAKEPVPFPVLFKLVQRDIPKQAMMAELMQSLAAAGKIIEVGKAKFLPKQRPVDEKAVYVDMNLLKEVTGK